MLVSVQFIVRLLILCLVNSDFVELSEVGICLIVVILK